LLETASKHNQEVLVSFVQEDQSLLPLKQDITWFKGAAHLENVQVLPSGEYMISQLFSLPIL
jgi:citrate lyase synthetase